MTTVVFDGYVLAADKRGTREGSERKCEHCNEISKEATDNFNKIIVPEKDIFYKGEKIIVFAMAGYSSFHIAMVNIIKYFKDFQDLIDCCVHLHGLENQHIILICEETAYLIKPIKKSMRKPGKFGLDIESVKYKEEFNDKGFMCVGSGFPYVKMAKDMLVINAAEVIELVSKYDAGTSPTCDTFVVRPYPEEKADKVEKVIRKEVKQAIKKSKPTIKKK